MWGKDRACPRPARAAASFARTCARRKNPPHTSTPPTRSKDCLICYNERRKSSSQEPSLSLSSCVRFKELSHAIPTSRLRRFLALGFLQRKLRPPLPPLPGLPTALFAL